MKFITLRDKTVTTPFGLSYEFKAGVPLHVAARCYEAVQAVGAVPEDEIPSDEPPAVTPPTAAEREALIIAAMTVMVEKGEREAFTAAGSPTTHGVSDAVGFIVSGPERDACWVKAQVSDD